MKIGTIRFVDQRTGDGVIVDDQGKTYNFNYPQVFMHDYAEGDKVAFSPVYEGFNNAYAQQIYSANNTQQVELLRRINRLEAQVMKLNDTLAKGFNEYDEAWIQDQAAKKND